LRITLGSAIGTSPTYTYSVVRPWSDRERYMRAAPMDLRAPSQHNLDPGRKEAERTNRMATTVGARQVSVRSGFNRVNFSSHWLSERVSNAKMISALDRKKP